jgi:hypothetical protein
MMPRNRKRVKEDLIELSNYIIKEYTLVKPSDKENLPNSKNRILFSGSHQKANFEYSNVKKHLIDANEDVYTNITIEHIAERGQEMFKIYAHLVDSVHRRIAIDWLIQANFQLGFADNTLFLSCFYFDKYLNHFKGSRLLEKETQKAALCALYLASRLNESSFLSIDDLLQASNYSFTKKEIIEIQDLFINEVLCFELLAPSVFELFLLYSVKVPISESDFKIAKFIMESSLMDPVLLSDIKILAISILYLIVVVKNKSKNAFQLAFNDVDLNCADFHKIVVKTTTTSMLVLNSSLMATKSKYLRIN